MLMRYLDINLFNCYALQRFSDRVISFRQFGYSFFLCKRWMVRWWLFRSIRWSRRVNFVFYDCHILGLLLLRLNHRLRTGVVALKIQLAFNVVTLCFLSLSCKTTARVHSAVRGRRIHSRVLGGWVFYLLLMGFERIRSSSF